MKPERRFAQMGLVAVGLVIRECLRTGRRRKMGQKRGERSADESLVCVDVISRQGRVGLQPLLVGVRPRQVQHQVGSWRKRRNLGLPHFLHARSLANVLSPVQMNS